MLHEISRLIDHLKEENVLKEGGEEIIKKYFSTRYMNVWMDSDIHEILQGMEDDDEITRKEYLALIEDKEFLNTIWYLIDERFDASQGINWDFIIGIVEETVKEWQNYESS